MKKIFEAHSTAGIHAKITREQQASAELGHTCFSKGVQITLTIVFLAAIAIVPSIQLAMERIPSVKSENAETGASAPKWSVFKVFSLLPSWKTICGVRSFSDAANLLPSTANIKDYDEALERESVVIKALLPSVQQFFVSNFGLGNEKAYIGRDGWLFYRPDIDYVTGRPFLDWRELQLRKLSINSPQPDPREAILKFAEQLKSRGIKLVLMPIPVKPMMEAEHFAEVNEKVLRCPIRNPSEESFFNEMRTKGIQVFDCASMLFNRKKSESRPQYLKTDTHWTPEAMDFVAGELSSMLVNDNLVVNGATAYFRKPAQISNLGDIAMMLKLPETQQIFHKETVTIQRVFQPDGTPWRSEGDSDILFLGDSFINIFSLGQMGWGESSGLAEQLSFHLQRPVDTILRNDAGSYATRELLSSELKKGRDRLNGKKIVIWEFADRELACGDWKILEMDLGKARQANFLYLESGQNLATTATVMEIASVPRPGTVPYKDHVVSMLLDDLSSPAGENRQALVYAVSMKNNYWTDAAKIKTGDRIKVKLYSWRDVENKFSGINRSDIKNEAAALEEPCWGEIVHEK
ncbi:MAG: hypothetical protein WAX69_23375 [Victivallales bacterium]